MKKIIISVLMVTLLFAGCAKEGSSGNSTEDFNTLKTTAINDL